MHYNGCFFTKNPSQVLSGKTDHLFDLSAVKIFRIHQKLRISRSARVRA
jgi:hypothetical protein